MSRKVICPACNGGRTEIRGTWGFDEGVFDCSLCKGKGVVTKKTSNILKKAEIRTDEQWRVVTDMWYNEATKRRVECPHTGHEWSCDFCKGKGYISPQYAALYPEWLAKLEIDN